MTVGVVLLVHDAFERAAQVARHWVRAGCPVVIHVDGKVASSAYDRFATALADAPLVQFSKRHVCGWGQFSLVQATITACEHLLKAHPHVSHVFLASGSCLPLRPIAELQAYLDAHKHTDFIESATTDDVPWTVGGLDRERFHYYFPFCWRKHRKLFDLSVNLQRRLRFRRKMPEGIVPHLGSQWWCLTRKTLAAILNDPQRPVFDAYFKSVWIPDESYFQTLARRHSKQIESRSLTLVKFDYQGKPHLFFDDHQELLESSGYFVARKVWQHANGLYARFPLAESRVTPSETDGAKAIDHVFSNAVEKRAFGRHGLYMPSRFPHFRRENGISAVPYSVFHGYEDLIPTFRDWLADNTKAEVHGHLFAPSGAEFSTNETVFRGGQSSDAKLRDYNPQMFLTNLIWNSPAQHQAFMFGPRDSQEITHLLATDTNAQIFVVTGSWAVQLFRTGQSAKKVRATAARLQKREHAFLKKLRSSEARARISITSIAHFLDQPAAHLQVIQSQLTMTPPKPLVSMPALADLDGLPRFLQELRNQGMHPFLAGEVSIAASRPIQPETDRKPYIVHKA